MTGIRVLRRLILLVAWTFAVCGVNSVVAFLLRMLGRSPLGSRIRFLHVWARGAAPILGIRVEVRGTPPRAPFYLACNHLGYLDILVLAGAVPCCFVAKREIAGWPLLGVLVRSMGTIFIDRVRAGDLVRVVEAMRGARAGGHGVTFFPEGTSTGGAHVLPFRASLFEAAASGGDPVCCASLWYGTPADGPSPAESVCWWGDMRFQPHFRTFLGLRRVTARVTFGDEPVRGTDRKELCMAAHAAVAGVFEPLDQGGSRA